MGSVKLKNSYASVAERLVPTKQTYIVTLIMKLDSRSAPGKQKNAYGHRITPHGFRKISTGGFPR